MRAFISILTFFLTLPLLSHQHKVDKINHLEDEKYLNFLAAVQNSSTFSYFTVIKVKNINTGVIKEICTKGNFVAGALHRELNVGNDKEGQQKVFDFAKSKKDRYFEFKNTEALDNISFATYDLTLLEKLQGVYNLDEVIKIIKQNKEFYFSLPAYQMKAFAHLLFNKGYLMGENNCRGGAIEYIDRATNKN